MDNSSIILIDESFTHESILLESDVQEMSGIDEDACYQLSPEINLLIDNPKSDLEKSINEFPPISHFGIELLQEKKAQICSSQPTTTTLPSSSIKEGEIIAQNGSENEISQKPILYFGQNLNKVIDTELATSVITSRGCTISNKISPKDSYVCCRYKDSDSQEVNSCILIMNCKEFFTRSMSQNDIQARYELLSEIKALKSNFQSVFCVIVGVDKAVKKVKSNANRMYRNLVSQVSQPKKVVRTISRDYGEIEQIFEAHGTNCMNFVNSHVQEFVIESSVTVLLLTASEAIEWISLLPKSLVNKRKATKDTLNSSKNHFIPKITKKSGKFSDKTSQIKYTFLRQVEEISHCCTEAAKAILSHYPSFRSLYTAAHSAPKNSYDLFSAITYSTDSKNQSRKSKNFGPAASRRLYTFLISSNPQQII